MRDLGGFVFFNLKFHVVDGLHSTSGRPKMKSSPAIGRKTLGPVKEEHLSKCVGIHLEGNVGTARENPCGLPWCRPVVAGAPVRLAEACRWHASFSSCTSAVSSTCIINTTEDWQSRHLSVNPVLKWLVAVCPPTAHPRCGMLQGGDLIDSLVLFLFTNLYGSNLV